MAKEVCSLVAERAASLVAISTVALAEFVITKIKASDHHKLSVALDGGVAEKFGAIREQIEQKIQEVLRTFHRDENLEIVLLPMFGCSCSGAAILCAAS